MVIEWSELASNTLPGCCSDQLYPHTIGLPKYPRTPLNHVSLRRSSDWIRRVAGGRACECTVRISQAPDP